MPVPSAGLQHAVKELVQGPAADGKTLVGLKTFPSSKIVAVYMQNSLECLRNQYAKVLHEASKERADRNNNAVARCNLRYDDGRGATLPIYHYELAEFCNMLAKVEPVFFWLLFLPPSPPFPRSLLFRPPTYLWIPVSFWLLLLHPSPPFPRSLLSRPPNYLLATIDDPPSLTTIATTTDCRHAD
jgi:hypothetical protein